MAFKIQLSAETRKRLVQEEREALRLYGLSDRWLARELIRMARVLRVMRPEFGPHDCVYDASVFWQIVPEIGFRLGERQFEQNERSNPEVRRLSNMALRIVAGISWRNCGAYAYRGTSEGRMFFREAVNGSPIVYALDRLALPDESDVIARHILEVSRYRNVQSTGIWTPAMLSA